MVYGTTPNGGTGDLGTIFSVSPSGTLTNLASFSGANGSGPGGSLTYNSTTNLFYGTTGQGGTNNLGTIFSVSPTGTLTNLASFNGTNGSYPGGSLTYDSTTNLFYGTTFTGSTNNLGTIFSVSPSGTLTNLASFDGYNGSFLGGSLTYDSTTNLFYGTTYGGTNNLGNIFSVSPSGTLTNLASFNGTNGSGPGGSLTLGSDGLFYGTTYAGGINDNGTIFSFDAGITAVPEPLNILGAGVAFGLGVLVKRRVK